MGATFSSIQVRSDSQEAVVQSLTGFLKEPAYVSPCVGGWTGVYPEGGTMDPDTLAAVLSSRLHTAVLDWSVYDSDVFMYSLYENGELRDKFNSDPGYFEAQAADSDEGSQKVDPATVRGNPATLLPYCVSGTTIAALRDVLHPAETDGTEPGKGLGFPEAGFQQIAILLGATADALKQEVERKSREKYVFADHQAADLARLLGIGDGLAQIEFSDIARDGLDDYDIEAVEANDFQLVGADNLSQKYKDDKLWSLDCLGRAESLLHWLQRGANPNTLDRNGQPLLCHHVTFPESVKILLDFGVDVNIVSTRSPYLAPEFPEMYGQYEAGVTALMVAAKLTDGQSERVEKSVRALIAAGADVNARSEAGRTALSEAIKMSDPDQHQRRLGRKSSQALVERSAAVSTRVAEMLRAAGATE